MCSNGYMSRGNMLICMGDEFLEYKHLMGLIL